MEWLNKEILFTMWDVSRMNIHIVECCQTGSHTFLNTNIIFARWILAVFSFLIVVTSTALCPVGRWHGMNSELSYYFCHIRWFLSKWM